MKRLQNIVHMYGGPTYAFDMEWKIRQFVVEVLSFALIERKEQTKNGNNWQSTSPNAKQGLKLDGEKGIEQFG